MIFFEDIVHHPELRHWPHVGIVVQAYLHSARHDVERLHALARARGAPITVRLVKGATGITRLYMPGNMATHARYSRRRLPRMPITNSSAVPPVELIDDLHPRLAVTTCVPSAHTTASARSSSPHAYELQMLYGMAEPERRPPFHGASGADLPPWGTPPWDGLPGAAVARKYLEHRLTPELPRRTRPAHPAGAAQTAPRQLATSPRENAPSHDAVCQLSLDRFY